MHFKEVKILPNIKSAKKRVQITINNQKNNAAYRSELRSTVKKSIVSINAGDVDTAKLDLKQAIVKLDKAVSKGLIHKNQAARKKSRLAKKVNAMA